MEGLILVAQQVFVLFALMGVGAALRWTKLVDSKSIDGMVNLLILVVTPCLIIDCFQRPFEPAMLKGLLAGLLIILAWHVVMIEAARFVVRERDVNVRRPMLLAAVFSNAGFMGVPLEQAILGSEGVFFGVLYVIVFNLFVWSWGLHVMKGGGRGATSVWKMLVNPGTIGIALGLPLFLFSWRLPLVVAEPVHQISNLNTPLAMIVIGYSLAGARLGRVLRLRPAYVAVACRLVVFPLGMIAVLYPFRALLDHRMMMATVIAASAPVAAMVSMFAMKFERDVDASVAVVCGSTLLSILTMPPIVALALAVL
jgi:malate permease and related proteins